MEKLGLFEGKEDREIPLKYSDRCKTPIEPYLSDQWFVKMGDRDGNLAARSAMDAVNDGRVKFFPERYAETYLDWLGEKRDWCISRQLWWGHRIPIWYTPHVTEAELTEAHSPAATTWSGSCDEDNGQLADLRASRTDLPSRCVSGRNMR